jgi:hypothetical protein
MSNISPSRDGLLKVQELLLLLGNGTDNVGILRPTNAIFNYSGPMTPEIANIVQNIRSTFQLVDSCIAGILADLPAE